MKKIISMVKVGIEPSVGEIVEVICSMNAYEQANLLCQLAWVIEENDGNASKEMYYIENELKTYPDKHRNAIKRMIDRFDKYFKSQD